jgi:hypothetical protein
MPMFGLLVPASVVNSMQLQLNALVKAFEDCEDTYLWLSAYALADLEAAPMSFSAADGQDILNAFADVHDLYQTALGTTGFPTAVPPYNFFASVRMLTAASSRRA